ncbi:MAG TPA: hypothetical protein VGM23_14465 [Armatimonadota bacterium]|jgi:hypothetical protein
MTTQRLRLLTLLTTIGLLLTALLVNHQALFGEATPKQSLEGLLKKAGFEYMKKDDVYKIPVEIEDETTIVYGAEESPFNDADSKCAILTTFPLTLPEGKKPSAAMLRKIAEMNSSIWSGRIGYDAEGNYIVYNSTIWLSGADAHTLSLELCLAHSMRKQIKKELQPFVSE